MNATLRSMNDEEFDSFLREDIPRFARVHVARGVWPAAGAEERSRREHATILPRGLRTPGHHFCVILDGTAGTRVGEIWYEMRPNGDRPLVWLVWIAVDEPYRRRGIARQALQVLEAEARAHGATRIGLNVDPSNLAARGLYASVGYTPVALAMSKSLIP